MDNNIIIGSVAGKSTFYDYPIVIGSEVRGYPLFMCADDDVIFKLKNKEIRLIELVNTIDNLNNKIKELEETVTEMKYAPGGSEYIKAKEHFEDLANI